MIYSSIGPISARFLLLLEFCRRRGISRLVCPEPGWASAHLQEQRAVFVQPHEIEGDVTTGLYDLSHEIGHLLLNLPEKLKRWFYRQYRRGTLLGICGTLVKETAAWAVGFLILKAFNIPTTGYLTHSLARLRGYFTFWDMARRRRKGRAS